MRVRLAAPIATAALALTLGPLASALVGCSSAMAEAEYAGPDVAPAPANPDGVPYPTDRIGWTAHKGTIPGDRIANLAFQGYVDSNRAAGLKTVSLADYFDPSATRVKAIHIQISATWCSICASETRATVAAREALVAEGAVLLQMIAQGPVSPRSPTLTDVTGWMDKHQTNFTVLLDPQAKRTGPLGVTGFPFNALIDPRSMEILAANLGAPDDVPKYVRLALTFVAKNKPSY
jgi:hypothetical protein